MRVTPDPIRTSRLLANSNSFQSSRRSSEDSLEDAGLGRDPRVNKVFLLTLLFTAGVVATRFKRFKIIFLYNNCSLRLTKF